MQARAPRPPSNLSELHFTLRCSVILQTDVNTSAERIGERDDCSDQRVFLVVRRRDKRLVLHSTAFTLANFFLCALGGGRTPPRSGPGLRDATRHRELSRGASSSLETNPAQTAPSPPQIGGRSKGRPADRNTVSRTWSKFVVMTGPAASAGSAWTAADGETRIDFRAERPRDQAVQRPPAQRRLKHVSCALVVVRGEGGRDRRLGSAVLRSMPSKRSPERKAPIVRESRPNKRNDPLAPVKGVKQGRNCRGVNEDRLESWTSQFTLMRRFTPGTCNVSSRPLSRVRARRASRCARSPRRDSPGPPAR
jgi:hypothetical protein